MAPPRFPWSSLWVGRLALSLALGLASAGAGLGCRTQYRPLVAPLPPQPVAPAIIEVGPVSMSKKKFGFFHQPSLNAAELADLAKRALRRAPDAEFFSNQSVAAVLLICPTARLPIWYILRVDFSGMAARTNLTAPKRTGD